MNQLPQPDPNAVMKIMRWVLMAFFAYVLFHSARDYTKPQPPVAAASTAPAAPPVVEQARNEAPPAPDCDRKSFPLFSVALLPQIIMNPKAAEVSKGSGDPALCGQKAEVHYEYRDSANKVIGKGDKHIAIGDGQLARGAELGLLGMQVGGENKIRIPSVLAYTHDGDVKLLVAIDSKLMTADIKLEKLSGAYPSSSFPLRAIITRQGGGTVIRCGDVVTLKLSVWKTDGTQIFSTEDKPLSFTLGKSEVPYGIEQALEGTREQSEMTVIIPPAFIKPLIDNHDSRNLVAGLPENEVLIARTEVLQVGGPAAKQGLSALIEAAAIKDAKEHNDDNGTDNTKKTTNKNTDKE